MTREIGRGLRRLPAELVRRSAGRRAGRGLERQEEKPEALRERQCVDDDPDRLAETVGAHLEIADGHFERGAVPDAAASFATAVRLAFDRELHFDARDSALAKDPRRFSAPFEASRMAQRLRAPRGRVTSDPAAGRPETGKDRARIAVVTRQNMNFLGEILALLESHPAVMLDHVDVAGDQHFSRGVFKPARLVEEILTGAPGMAGRVDQVLRSHLEDADVLFVEWCSALAALVNLIDPGDTRVVIRLHSYEAFTHWPHLLDFSRIDDLVFVSEHLRDFAIDAVPGLREPHAPRMHVLPLAQRLRGFVRPKSAEARFRLGLVGWSGVAKDPLWALDVLRELRRHDERYALDLIGSDFADHVSPGAESYGTRLHAELEEWEAAGAVRRVGQTDDVAAALTDVGVILSTSVRESFHAGLVEGAASGAVPVVRDWPFFAGRATSARTVYPPEWIVTTPQEAAKRIIESTADEERWRAAGSHASQHALTTWDWEVVKPAYERFFLE